MKESQQENYPVRGHDAIALPPSTADYGMVRGIRQPLPAYSSNAGAVGIETKLRFYGGEIWGLLFVILTTVYIFAIPASCSRQGRLSEMIGLAIKRSIDIIGSIIGLVLTSPLWLILPVLIKIDSPGGVFYTQVRVGTNRRQQERRFHQKVAPGNNRVRERRREDYLGKPFRMIKFRTMVSGAERESGPVWATKNDSRVTRLGSFMRKTRLDEIPQFINILLGDMSLVGPRPERPTFVKELSGKVDDYYRRLEVKPGLTGLAQVENGYDASVDSVVLKVEHDLKYIREWSLWNDFKILCRTVIVVITGRGAQ